MATGTNKNPPNLQRDKSEGYVSAYSEGYVTGVEDESEEEWDLSTDDDEMYLDDDEPFGTTLMPSPDPYDRSQRVKDLNQELKRSQTQVHIASKVSFHEESNQYYSEDDYILNINKTSTFREFNTEENTNNDDNNGGTD